MHLKFCIEDENDIGVYMIFFVDDYNYNNNKTIVFEYVLYNIPYVDFFFSSDSINYAAAAVVAIRSL